LLGVAEAGFFPGVILYLTYWYPAHRRARIVALFMTAVALSGVVGGPLSGWIMQTFAGVNGWAGWQWLFLLEGLPSVLMGVWVFFSLDDSIRHANWLAEEEKQVLERAIADEEHGKRAMTLGQVFASGQVWLLAFIYFTFVMGLYAVSFWLPQLIKASGVKDVLDIGLLTAIPYSAAVVLMIVLSRSSDRSGERRWHIAGAALLGAAGLLASALYGDNTLIAMTALTIATAGIISTLPLFWTLPTALLGGSAAAAGIAMINSIGNLAGFASPYLVGVIKDATQSTTVAMTMLAGILVLGALTVIFRIAPPARRPHPAP
jgi:MFS family permease